MEREQVTHSNMNIQIDIISSGNPFSAQTWKEPLMVGAQLLGFSWSSVWPLQEGPQYVGNGLALKSGGYYISENCGRTRSNWFGHPYI